MSRGVSFFFHAHLFRVRQGIGGFADLLRLSRGFFLHVFFQRGVVGRPLLKGTPHLRGDKALWVYVGSVDWIGIHLGWFHAKIQVADLHCFNGGSNRDRQVTPSTGWMQGKEE